MKEEKYTPEEIIQAMSVVLSKHGKIYIDEVILELKKISHPLREGVNY